MTRLPPGPPVRLLSTYRALAQCFRYYPLWRARYGDPFTLRAVNGTILLTADPALIKQIFTAPPAVFAPFGVEAIAPLMGPASLLLLNGERHRRERALLMPPFHGSRMRTYGEQMQGAALQHLRGARGTTSFQALAQKIALDIIIRTVFGIEQEQRIQSVLDSIVQVIDGVHPAFLFMPFLQLELGGFGPYARFKRRYHELDGLLREEIQNARRRANGQDILSLLVQARYEDGSAMDEDAICDELRTIVVAGHETTALSLAWAVDLLHRSPPSLERLRAELGALGPDATPEQFAGLEYLDAVCKETLRLYPPVTEVLRLLRAPFELGAYSLDAGTAVAANIVLAHRDPERFVQPELFRPERFIERSFTPFEYLPFGGGHRRCIGSAFASFEMKIVLAALLSHFEVTLVNDKAPRPVRRNVTIAPHDGVPLLLKPRSAPVCPALQAPVQQVGVSAQVYK
jgi:cytochrome P450 family 110